MVDNKAIEQIGFTQLSLGEISHQLTHPTYIQVQDWRYERGVIEQVEMPSRKLGCLPSGFAQIAAVRHTLAQEGVAAVNAVSQAGRKQEMVQIVFSDGLAAISSFLEPRPQNRSESVAQQGAVNIRSKRLGDFWLTIVGEIPEVAV